MMVDMNATASPPAPVRILVVDDDRLVLATVAHGLTQAGFEVIDADNGDDAILLARRYRPALALLDIRMEGLSGFDVAEYLRQQLGIPFMFLSAFADEETRAKVQALGAVAYLTKPLDNRQIVPAVQAALARVRSSVPTPVPVPSEPAASAPGLDLEAPGVLVALAVGILMHRHGCDREAAMRRLAAAAEAAGCDPARQAGRVVAAIEQLARTAPL
jgi:response regulator NasT